MLGSKTFVTVFALFGLTAGCAQAADILNGSTSSYKDGPGAAWVVTLGGYAGGEPEFPGAKGLTFGFRPIVEIRREGAKEWLGLPNDAVGLTLYETSNFRFGAAGDLLTNRDRSNDSALRGLHNIDYTLELGAFAEYYPVPFIRTRVELLQGVTGADGFVANLMADYIYRPDARWLFTAGPRLRFVNTQYESTFFSISRSESVASGLPHFHASGGLDSAGIDATVRYNVSERLSLRAFAEWDRLTGDGADSPLVKLRGSEDQFQFGVGAAYKFTYRP
jgi:MipA family protein